MIEKRLRPRLDLEEGVRFKYRDKSYPIYNLSDLGFCFLSNQPQDFKVGQCLLDIILSFLDGGEVTCGQIIHITPYLEGEDPNSYLIGVKFVWPGDDNDYFESLMEEE